MFILPSTACYGLKKLRHLLLLKIPGIMGIGHLDTDPAQANAGFGVPHTQVFS